MRQLPPALTLSALFPGATGDLPKTKSLPTALPFQARGASLCRPQGWSPCVRGAPPPGPCEWQGRASGWGEPPAGHALTEHCSAFLGARGQIQLFLPATWFPTRPLCREHLGSALVAGERWAWGRGEAAGTPDAAAGPVARVERADGESDNGFQVSEEVSRGHRNGSSALPQEEELFSRH